MTDVPTSRDIEDALVRVLEMVAAGTKSVSVNTYAALHPDIDRPTLQQWVDEDIQLLMEAETLGLVGRIVPHRQMRGDGPELDKAQILQGVTALGHQFIKNGGCPLL